MSELIVASGPGLVTPGERAFVERLAAPSDHSVSYSAVLTAQDCAEVDRSAYHDARTWYRAANGEDSTLVSGVSLGRAFEYVATTELVRAYRATRVLQRLHDELPIDRVVLRDVTREWAHASLALEIPVRGADRLETGPLPGAMVTPPPLYHRAAARVLALPARASRIGLVDARAWAIPYGSALAARWPLRAIEPGPRFVLGMFRARRPMKVTWLAEAEFRGATGPRIRADSNAASVLDELFDAFTPSMRSAAELGAEHAREHRVAVACQDVLPPVRAFLLGFRGAGGRIVTLEHGISGTFVDQVETIADVLGVWGEPHRAYHVPIASSDTLVRVVGWPRLEGVARRKVAEPEFDVVFFSQPTQDIGCASWPEDVLRARAMIEAYAAAHPHRRVAVKPHPSSDVYGWASRMPGGVRTIGGDSLSVLRRTRVAAMELSTTAIEAMAIGVPVVQLGPQRFDGPDFIAASGAPRATTADELADAIEGHLSDPLLYGRSRDRGRTYAESFVATLTQTGAAAGTLIDIVADLAPSR